LGLSDATNVSKKELNHSNLVANELPFGQIFSELGKIVATMPISLQTIARPEEKYYQQESFHG
jgi:hypothetical protein